MKSEIYVKTMHGIVTEVATAVVTSDGRKWNMAFVVGLTGGTKFQVNFPVKLQVKKNDQVRAVEVLENGKLMYYPVIQNMGTGKIAHVDYPFPRQFAPINLILSVLSASLLGAISGGTLWALDRFEICANNWWPYGTALVALAAIVWDARVAHVNHLAGSRYLNAIKNGIAKHYDARNWARILVRHSWRKVLVSAVITTQPNNIALSRFDPTHINTQPRGIDV